MNPQRTFKKPNDRGAVLIVVLGMSGILIVLLLVGSTLFQGGARRVQATARRTQAFYLAEAAIEKAILQLNGNWNNTGDIPVTSLTIEDENPSSIFGRFEATITPNGDYQRTITGIGYVPSRSRRIEVVLERKKLFSSSIFDFALAAEKLLSIQGGAGLTIDGPMYIGDSYLFEGNPEKYLSQDITVNLEETYQQVQDLIDHLEIGDTVQVSRAHYPIPNISDLALEWWNRVEPNASFIMPDTENVSINDDVWIDGDLVIKRNVRNIHIADGKLIYVKGNVDFHQANKDINFSGKGMIVVEGNEINFGNSNIHYLDDSTSLSINFLFADEADPTIEIKTTGNPNIKGILFAPQAILNFTGTPSIIGSVVANTIIYQGSSDIDYDAEIVSNQPAVYTSEFGLTNWKEL